MKTSTLLLAALVLTTGLSTAAIAGHHMEGGEKGGWFAKVDTDGDGAISKAEFLAHKEEKFNKMDADGDGNVTMDEKKAYKAMKKEKYKEMKEKHGDHKDHDGE